MITLNSLKRKASAYIIVGEFLFIYFLVCVLYNLKITLTSLLFSYYFIMQFYFIILLFLTIEKVRQNKVSCDNFKPGEMSSLYAL